jgi:hypothetical protein
MIFLTNKDRDKRKGIKFYELSVGETFMLSAEDSINIVLMKTEPFCGVVDAEKTIGMNCINIADGSFYYMVSERTVYPVRVTAEWERI